jgi:hypothetical protein
MAVIPTDNHGYKKQEKGDDDWHIALNDTLDILDVDVVLRDQLSDRSAAGTQGRIFIATDTNELYFDDGSSWNRLLTLDHGDLNGLGDDDHPQYLLEDGTRAMSGDLDMGKNKVVNAERYKSNQQSLTQSMETGLLSGGNPTRTSNTRELRVSPGTGFVRVSGDNQIVEFPEQTITIGQDKSGFLFIDADGNVGFQETRLDKTKQIKLANVGTAENEISILATNAAKVGGNNALDHTYRTQAIGPVAVDGGLASQSDTLSLGFDVSQADFFVADNFKSVPGNVSVTFKYWYRSGDGWWNYIEGKNEVDPTVFDDGSGTLQPVPDDKFKKDLLFINEKNGEPEYNVLIGQELFDDQKQAEASQNPDLRDNNITPFLFRSTGIITKGDSTTIESFKDERPFIGQFKSKSERFTDHGNLTGLGDDDHPQYLLENEVREVAKAESASRPDRKYFSDLDYSSTNSMPTGTVIYVKLFLKEGQSYSGVSTYHTSSSDANRAVGIYSESNNKPDSLLETSGVQSVTLSDGEFNQLNFQSTFTVPSTDEYFVAFLGDSSTNAFVTNASVNANVPISTNTPFVPTFSESQTVTDGLPATASSSVFKSNLPFIALER